MKSEKTVRKQILTAVLWCAVAVALVLSMLQYFGVSFDVSAGYSKTFPFQGRLTNPDGTNVADGDYDMTFRMYDADSGGNELWSEGHTGANDVTVEDGVFNVTLGTLNAITPDFNSGTYWLEIAVEGETLSPRRRIGGTGYAINSDHVEGYTAAELMDSLWIDSGGALSPKPGASDNVNIDNGSLNVSGIITANTNETINGIDINSGTISDATWNGTALTDVYVVALNGASQGDILYHNGTQWIQLTAGTSGRFLMTQGAGANPTWNAVSGTIANGTVASSTLRWDGAAWSENTGILTTTTTITGTGALTIGTGGAFVLGDGGDTININSSDWDVSIAGAMTGIDSVANTNTAALTITSGIAATWSTVAGQLDITGAGGLDLEATTGSDVTVTLGGVAGDDFLVDGDTLVVSSDTNNVGINDNTPTYDLDITAGTTRAVNIYNAVNDGYGIYTWQAGGWNEWLGRLL